EERLRDTPRLVAGRGRAGDEERQAPLLPGRRPPRAHRRDVGGADRAQGRSRRVRAAAAVESADAGLGRQGDRRRAVRDRLSYPELVVVVVVVVPPEGAAFATQLTVNALPSPERLVGEAPAVELAEALTSPKKRRARGTSWIGVDSQPGPESVPPWPFPSAAIFENVTDPKFVSGTVRHNPVAVHSEGASVIHSAEVRSGFCIGRCLVKE